MHLRGGNETPEEPVTAVCRAPSSYCDVIAPVTRLPLMSPITSCTSAIMRLLTPKKIILFVSAAAILTAVLSATLYNSKKRVSLQSLLVARQIVGRQEDTRPEGCFEIEGQYGSESVENKVSVIIYASLGKDSLFTLTVASVVANSERELLGEILIVFPTYVDELAIKEVVAELTVYGSVVRVIESSLENTVQSRLFVARDIAAGSVVVLLTDEVVVNRGWLRPLVRELKHWPGSLVVPQSDYFDRNLKAIVKLAVPYIWIFDWSFAVWPFVTSNQPVSESEADVIPTPVFPGRIFASHKGHLKDITRYKGAAVIEGGLELSFLSWLCGGGVRVVPCSRVGTTSQPSAVAPPRSDVANYFARRYLDEPLLDVYRRVKGYVAMRGNTSEFNDGSASLFGCKKFSWYMKEIATDVFMPDNSTKAYGPLCTAAGSAACFARSPQMTLVGSSYPKIRQADQVLSLNDVGQLRMGDDCVRIDQQGYAVIDDCDPRDATQSWTLDTESWQLRQLANASGCLMPYSEKAEDSSDRLVIMVGECRHKGHPELPWQQWRAFTALRD